MHEDAVKHLNEALASLEEAELAWLVEQVHAWREGMAESRPQLGEFWNALLGVLENERLDRPARGRSEVEQLASLFDGTPVDDDDVPGGWVADRPGI